MQWTLNKTYLCILFANEELEFYGRITAEYIIVDHEFFHFQIIGKIHIIIYYMFDSYYYILIYCTFNILYFITFISPVSLLYYIIYYLKVIQSFNYDLKKAKSIEKAM